MHLEADKGVGGRIRLQELLATRATLVLIRPEERMHENAQKKGGHGRTRRSQKDTLRNPSGAESYYSKRESSSMPKSVSYLDNKESKKITPYEYPVTGVEKT